MGDMAGMSHGAPAASCPPEHAAMGHCQPGPSGAAMDHDAMKHDMRDFANAPGLPRTVVVQTVSPMPMDRTGEPPQGLADVGHRVLTYRDLKSVAVNPIPRAVACADHPPDRQYGTLYVGVRRVKLNAVTAPIPFGWASGCG